MSQNLTLSLWITGVGMGLVFAAILLLWGMMALLVRLTEKRVDKGKKSSSPDSEFKQRAAIAAISIALMQELDSEPHEFPLPPTASVSAWQGVMRTHMLTKRGLVR